MLKNKKSYLLKNIEMKCIYTAVSLCITSIGLAQSLSFSEALDRMRGANQKLKGMEKQAEASQYGEKKLQGFVSSSAEYQCKLYTLE